jgi:hypothetical protein
MARKQVFKLPYAGVDKSGEFDLLVGHGGECSAVISMTNPIIRYGASPASYDEFHGLMTSIIKILGEGYLLQKQDVISRRKYSAPRPAEEYLEQKYDAHFAGREYQEVFTYLTITMQVKKGAFFVYDPKTLKDFRQSVRKVVDILARADAGPRLLQEGEINLLVTRVLSMNFGQEPIVLNNLSPADTEIKMGGRSVRNISLVNTDSIDLPQEAATHILLHEKETLRGFPVDFLSFLFSVPGLDVILFNQVIEIPPQALTLKKLELKKNRHSGFPDPANLLCAADIDQLLTDVAKENQILVNCHFNLVITAPDEQIHQGANFIESALFQLGITPSRNAYNQLELFRSALPGNAVELKDYDWFLTTGDAAICFFFKESLPKDEASDFLIRFTDRQGVPLGIDPSDLPMRTGRIGNRNRFCLGPSGSGKSFFMNALLGQYMRYNMDVVIVDTGHSYSGLCAYYQGKYITYTKKKPITMNPFQISREEYDIEKKDFLCTLIGVAWKGAEGTFTPVERDVISSVIGAYYSQYFNFRDFSGLSVKEQHGVRKRVLQQMRTGPAIDSDGDDPRWEDFDDMQQLEISRTDEVFLEEFGYEIKPDGSAESTDPFEIAFEKAYQAALGKETARARSRHEQDMIRLLNFNSFYEFALRTIPLIKTQEQISFAFDEFRYVLKKFYRGGEFSSILNEATDESLFTEKFIVFEIDAIKENRILFPIVTLIIMDVFIQKMRYRSQRRKTLVVEEAWKALASPLMASYLLYLYKTVRKFWGEAIVVTQELGDIIGNAVVKDSIISNSDTICLLDQTKFRDDYAQISALLSIGETERRKIFSINQLDNTSGRDRFKEVYIRRGAVGEVYGVEVSIEQYLIFTTEKPEKSAVEIYVAAYGSYPAGIDQMVAGLRRSKLPLGEFVSQVNRSGRPVD